MRTDLAALIAASVISNASISHEQDVSFYTIPQIETAENSPTQYRPQRLDIQKGTSMPYNMHLILNTRVNWTC